MTTPNLDFLGPLPEEVPQANLSFLGPTEEESKKPQGFVDFASNYIMNSMHLDIAYNPDHEKWYFGDRGMSPDSRLKVEQYRAALADVKPGTELALRDFGNLFTKMFTNTAEAGKRVIEDPKAFVNSVMENPTVVGGQILVGLFTPLSSLMEAHEGVHVTSGEIRALTPVERSERIKEVVATGVGFLASAGVGKAVGLGTTGVQTGLRIGATRAVPDVVKYAQKAYGIGELGKDMLRYSAVGVGGGTAYGAVRYANEEGQLAEMLLNGLVFGTVGSVVDLTGLFGKKGRIAQHAESRVVADNVANLRQKMAMDESTLFDIKQTLEAFTTADSQYEALMNSTVTLPNNAVLMINGVSADVASHKQNFQGRRTPEGEDYAHRSLKFKRDDGKYNILVVNESNLRPSDGGTWGIYGYLQGQLVSMHGRGEYLIHALSSKPDASGLGFTDKVAHIEDLKTGKRQSVPLSEVSHLTNMGLGDPVAQINSVARLKTTFFTQLRALGDLQGFKANKTPLVKEAIKAFESAVHGQPVSVIGFRQRRGTPLPGTGRFSTPMGHLVGGYSGDLLYDKNPGIGNPSTLTVARYNFKNPLVLESGQLGLDHAGILDGKVTFTPEEALMYQKLKSIAMHGGVPKYDKDGNVIKYREEGHSRLDLFLAPIYKRHGYDGVLYRNKQIFGDDEYQIVDLTEQAVIDKPESTVSTAMRFSTPDQKDFIRAMYRDWLNSTATVEGEHTRYTRLMESGKDKKLADLTFDELYARARSYEMNDMDLLDPNDRTKFEYPEYGEIQEAMRQRAAGGERTSWHIKEEEVMDRLRKNPKPAKKMSDYELQVAYRDAINHSNGFQEQLYKKELRARALSEDSTVAVDLKDFTPPPGWSWVKSMEAHLKNRGFTDAEMPMLRREFEREFWNDITSKSLDPEELRLIEQARDENTKAIEAQATVDYRYKEFDADRLARAANNNGMYIQLGEAGRVEIRDIRSDRLLTTVSTYDKGVEFIRSSAQERGVDIDRDFPIPPGGTGGDLLGGMGNYEQGPISVFGQLGKMDEVAAALASGMDFFTPLRSTILSLDARFRTKLFTEVFDSLQQARKKANAAIKPYYDILQKLDRSITGMGRREREITSGWVETMSPDEVKERYLARPMNVAEIRFATELVNGNIDIGRVFNFRRQRTLLRDKVKDITTPEHKQAEIDLRNSLGIDSAHMKAVDMFDAVTRMRKNQIDLNGVVRLARSMRTVDGKPEMTRVEYAAHHKMSAEQIRLGTEIENLFGRLSSEFGIPKENRLGNYYTHARLYNDGNISATLDQFGYGDPVAKKFYAELARTGELDAYELDPIRAAQRYIKAGFDAQHFNEPRALAEKAAKVEIKKLPVNMQKQAERYIERYFADIQGHPGADVRSTQATVDHLFDRLGLKISVDVRKNIVGYILATGEAAAQGMRLVAGLRDFATGVTIHYAKFGAKRTAEMINYGMRGMEGMDAADPAKRLTAKDLRAMGMHNEATALAMADPVERQNTSLGLAKSKAVTALKDFTDIAFTMSGQKHVYSWLQAGSFFSAWKTTSKGIADFNAGKITREQLYKEIGLGKYQEPVIREFERLLRDEPLGGSAAEFLGVQTGYDVVGVYGLANHPTAWGSNVGKLAGQFGSWSAWFTSQAAQMVSRGTLGERAAVAARFALAVGATQVVGDQLGFDLRSWNPLRGIFAGGPAVDLYMNFADAVGGYGMKQRVAKSNLLRYLPYDPIKEQWNVGQIWAPGSFFLNDLAKAYDLAKRGYNPVAVTGQALGVRVDQTERSGLDQALGTFPRLRK